VLGATAYQVPHSLQLTCFNFKLNKPNAKKKIIYMTSAVIINTSFVLKDLMTEKLGTFHTRIEIVFFLHDLMSCQLQVTGLLVKNFYSESRYLLQYFDRLHLINM
jgi:hypothetical protein